jgi:hypothetical protein
MNLGEARIRTDGAGIVGLFRGEPRRRRSNSQSKDQSKESTMKFLCLICAEKVMEQMSADDADRLFDEYAAFTDEIRESGHFVACNRLTPSAAAVTVRVRNGKISTTDGPFAETKEQFGGYYVIEARDLAEAIRVAGRIPGARMGCVEVRPVAEDARTLEALGLEGSRA